MYFFLLSYTILGAGIKYIDSAYDEKTFNKNSAMILAPLLGLLWTYTMFINPFSATLIFAILIDVLLKRKIEQHPCINIHTCKKIYKVSKLIPRRR